ncbi:ABC transporter permease [Roseivirga sp. BDSF3-8]|uniref:ABC transporter permease n=1 Tax=Roseivirga sp. BDSF3-8 TaxID=3241598 RepID=UPI0035323CC8
MNKQYLIVAWRYLRQHRLYFLINVMGLTVGVTVSLVLMLHVLDEAFYNRNLPTKGDIYQAVYRVSLNQRSYSFGETSHSLKPYVDTTRLAMMTLATGSQPVKDENDRVWMATDRPISQFFNLEVIEGHLETPWEKEGYVIISDRFASRLFREGPYVGRKFQYQDKAFIVAAVVKDLPYNNTVFFDVLGAFHSSLPVGPNHQTLVMEKTTGQGTGICDQISHPSIPWIDQMGLASSVYLVPYEETFEHSGIIGNPSGIWQGLPPLVIWGVALVVILLVTGNYTALSTVQNYSRYPETGLRKMLGASRLQVAGQFMAESFLLVSLAVVFALIITDQLLPFFNSLTGKAISLRGEWSYYQWTGILGVSIITLLCTVILPSVQLANIPSLFAMARVRKSTHGYNILRKWWAGSQVGILWLLLFLAYMALRADVNPASTDLAFSSSDTVLASGKSHLPQRNTVNDNTWDNAIALQGQLPLLKKQGPVMDLVAVLICMSIAWAMICIWALIGLATYERHRNALSIKIKKLAGASARQLALDTEKRYIYLTLMAILFMLPPAYAAIQFWLPEVVSATAGSARPLPAVWGWVTSIVLCLIIATTIPLLPVYPGLRGKSAGNV